MPESGGSHIFRTTSCLPLGCSGETILFKNTIQCTAEHRSSGANLTCRPAVLLCCPASAGSCTKATYLPLFPRSALPAINSSRCDCPFFFAICLPVCLSVYVYPRRVYVAHSTQHPSIFCRTLYGPESTCTLSEIYLASVSMMGDKGSFFAMAWFTEHSLARLGCGMA